MTYKQFNRAAKISLGNKPTVDLHHNLAPSLSDWTVTYRPKGDNERMFERDRKLILLRPQ